MSNNALVIFAVIVAANIALLLFRRKRNPGGNQETAAKKKDKKFAGLVVAAIFGITAIAIGVGFGPAILRDMDASELLETGVRAPARIVDMEDTGNRMNHNPEVRLKLEISPEGGHPFTAYATDYLSPVSMAKKPVGSTITVAYDPKDPTKVVLVPW